MTYLQPSNGTIETEATAPSGSSQLISVTSSGTAHTKGSYAEIVATTTFTYEGFILHINTETTTQVRAMFDIAVGAAASEVVIFPNLLLSTNPSRPFGYSLYIPLRVAQGERVSVRFQSSSSSQVLKVGITGMSKGLAYRPIYSTVTVLGEDTSDTTGVAIDITVANTKSAYVSLGTLPDGDINGVKAVMLALGDGGDLGQNVEAFFYDLAIGTASNEEIVIPDIYQWSNSQEETHQAFTKIYPFAFHSEEIRIRCQANLTTNDRDAVFYGFN